MYRVINNKEHEWIQQFEGLNVLGIGKAYPFHIKELIVYNPKVVAAYELDKSRKQCERKGRSHYS